MPTEAPMKILTESECWERLDQLEIGRMAYHLADEVHITPVNYAVDGESVLVRTTAYSLLGTHGRDTTVCFEVDQFDYENQRMVLRDAAP